MLTKLTTLHLDVASGRKSINESPITQNCYDKKYRNATQDSICTGHLPICEKEAFPHFTWIWFHSFKTSKTSCVDKFDIPNVVYSEFRKLLLKSCKILRWIFKFSSSGISTRILWGEERSKLKTLHNSVKGILIFQLRKPQSVLFPDHIYSLVISATHLTACAQSMSTTIWRVQKKFKGKIYLL